MSRETRVKIFRFLTRFATEKICFKFFALAQEDM